MLSFSVPVLALNNVVVAIIFMVYDIDQLYLLINNNNVALIKHHVVFTSHSLKAPTVPSSIYTKLLPAIQQVVPGAYYIPPKN